MSLKLQATESWVTDDIEHFGDVSFDNNVESFLQQDGGDARELYDTMKQTLIEHKAESSKGFSFGEVGCIRTRMKVLCCHFSKDGKLLASAGHDKKIVVLEEKKKEAEKTELDTIFPADMQKNLNTCKCLRPKC